MTSIKLPSGLSGEVRRFKAGDWDLFSDPALVRKKGPAVSAALCKLIWQKTDDPGPYTLLSDGRPDWGGNVLEQDRFALLLNARINTLGDTWEADFPCFDPYCNARIPWTIPLRELPIRDMPEEVAAAYHDGNRLAFVLPECGKTVVYNLPTFDVQRRVSVEADLKENGRGLTSIYAGRIESVDDVRVRSQIHTFVKGMEYPDWVALKAEINRTDFGVDTEIEVECEACSKTQKHPLIWGADFFMPAR